MKTCTRCKKTKSENEFWKHSGRKGGLHSWCKDCQKETTKEWRENNHEKDRIRHKIYCQTHPEYRKNRKYYREAYGLSDEEYLKLIQDHCGKCAICGRKKRLFIDHNHSTGKVRGLLCGACNTGIGFLGDSIEILENAKKYLSQGDRQ